MILTKKGQIVLKPEEEIAQRKKISQKKLRKQKLLAQEQIQPKINSNKSKSRMLVVFISKYILGAFKKNQKQKQW